MQLPFAQAGQVLRGWTAAIRNLPSNELATYWNRIDRRQLEAKHWLKRHISLFIPGIILAAISTAIIIGFIIDIYLRSGIPSTKLYAVSNVITGISILSACTITILAVWLIKSVFKAGLFCMGFLSASMGTKTQGTVYEILGVTGIGSQNILVSLGYYCLRITFLPLLLFCFFLCLHTFCQDISGWSNTIITINQFAGTRVIWGWALISFVYTMFKHVTGGMLVILAYCFMWCGLSRISTTSATAVLTIWLHVGMQLLLPISSTAMLKNTEIRQLILDSVFIHHPVIASFLPVMVLAVLMYFAQRSMSITRLIMYGYPLVIFILSFLIYHPIITFEPSSLLNDALAIIGLASQSLGVFNPVTTHMHQFTTSAVVDGSGFYTAWWNFPISLLAKLVFLGIMAEIARYAVLRRFAGGIES